jgi:hypothetical protein
VLVSFERSLPKIRKLLRGASTALIDATDDHAQAIDAYLQATAQLGAGAVMVYTEVMHDSLELFVRGRGSVMLLGPSFDGHYMKFLERLPERKKLASAMRMRARGHLLSPKVFD